MTRLLSFLLFRAPFWVYLCLALGVGYLTEVGVGLEREKMADKAIARELPVPAVVDLSEFDETLDKGVLDEVHVTGWIAPEYNKHLIKRTNGVKTGERYLFVMFGAKDGASSTVAKAAMILTQKEREHFLDNLSTYAISSVGGQPLFKFNGTGDTHGGYASLALKSMRKDGIKLSTNFVYLEPYWDGRQAAFAETTNNFAEIRMIGHGIVLVFALIAALKWRRWSARRAQTRRSVDKFHDSPISSAADPRPVSMPAPTAVSNPTMAFSDNSPLGRIRNRAQLAVAPDLFKEDIAPSNLPQAKKTQAKKSWLPFSGLPNWMIGFGTILFLALVLPSNLSVFLLPILTIAGIYYFYVKILEAIGKGVTGAFHSLTGLGGNAAATQRSELKSNDNPFARLH